MSTKITINRAPVMTLWATVVAERIGYEPDEALTLAKAVTGLNAQSKGRRLGIFSEQPEEDKPEKQRQHKADDTFSLVILGRHIPAINTPDGIRAVEKDKPIQPASVQRYLETKFGADLSQVQEAFKDLASSYPPEELKLKAYQLYETFRPKVPQGQMGWGAKGELDLDVVGKLKK